MPTPSRRRWFQFSLRGLFVAVTLLALYLGWTMNWIRQRREFLTANVFEDDQRGGMTWPHRLHTGANAPGLLRLLGETGYSQVMVRPHIPDEDSVVRFGEHLFPEAVVRPIEPKH